MKTINMVKNIKGKAFVGLSFLTLALSMSSCDKDVFDINADPFKGKQYANMLGDPISTYLSSEEDFSEYVKALKYSNTYNALNQSSSGTSFTVFAPNNDAMREFYQRRGVDSLKNMSADYVRSFVLYHTLNDSILPADFITKDYVTNLTGDDVTVTIDSVNAGEADLNGEGHVVEMGISAYNGKIYVLSKALTPLVETILDRVKEKGNSTIMVQALEQTGWSKKLSVIKDTIDNVVTKYDYTFLNVSDAVFAQSGIGSIDALKSKLQAADSRGLSVDSLLKEYVGYHILKSNYTTSDLGTTSGSSVTRLWGTSAKNQVIALTTDTAKADGAAGKYVLNASGTSAELLSQGSNVVARNGYVHELGSWLPVWVPQQETVVWDLADYPQVKNIVPSEYFQPSAALTSETVVNISSASCFTCVEGGAGTANRSYSMVSYVPSTTLFKKANNLDRVVFNVGAQGSVEMETPTIIRGKYKVSLSLVYTTSQAFMRQQQGSNGGRIIVTFDDANQIETAPYTNVTSALPGVYTYNLYDEIEFDETSSHKFKFVVNDQAASTKSGFSLQFDCITFTPID